MKITIVLFLLLSLGKVSGQNYAEEHYQFDSLYKTMEGYYNRGLYFKAAELPKKFGENRYVDASAHYFFARVYSLSNEFDKTLFALKNAVEGGITKSQIEKMYDLDAFRESNLNVIFESSYPSWHQVYLDNLQSLKLDSVYIKRIKEINEKYLNNLRGKSANKTDERKDSVGFYYKSKRIDSICFNELVALTLELGFPTKRSIGSEFYWYSRILRYNIPENYDVNCKDWKKIKSLIGKEIKKGTIYPFYYAAIEDRIRLVANKPQYYGTMTVMHRNSADGTNLIQYENPEELNVRRKAVGLCSIHLEMWSEAIELPKSLKGVEFK